MSRILDLWPDIIAALPDATLVISTYVAFPCNDDERRIQARIAELNQIHPGQKEEQEHCIRHLGQLNPAQLYAEMGAAEYWLYPTDWPETSCITAMEMLMSGVICLYYPVAGLTDTMGGCGIQVAPGSELETLCRITSDETQKAKQREQGRAYAEGCTWTHRAQQWVQTLNPSNTLQTLKKNTMQEYDFGIFKSQTNSLAPRIQKIVDFLRCNHFSVHECDNMDSEVAKCKIILNAHASTTNDAFENAYWFRLIEAGINVVSEPCCDLDAGFMQQYPNARVIAYDDFFDIGTMVDCYNNPFASNAHNAHVLSVLNKCYHEIDFIPVAHISFLKKLSLEFNPEKMVVYDIGSSVLHWSWHVQQIWKHPRIYAFDAMTEMKLYYDTYNETKNAALQFEYSVGVLCDEDHKRIAFYQNDDFSGGNSYYKEIGHPNSHNLFTETHVKHKMGMKLETVVKNRHFPLPDLIKIDVQGAELDILKGSMSIINCAKFLIVELQHTEYNRGAPLCNETRDFLIENGWEVYAEKFSNNGPDADWCFINRNRNRTPQVSPPAYKTMIINLKRRSDRKVMMESRLQAQPITEYEFVDAVDGSQLLPTAYIQRLFHGNNFNYRKGVIGCAMSHLALWKRLMHDTSCDVYVVIEDDAELVDNFELKLQKAIQLFMSDPRAELCYISGFSITDPCTNASNLQLIKKDNNHDMGTGGYLIKKSGAVRFVDYYDTHSMKASIDASIIIDFNEHLYKINQHLIKSPFFGPDTDIQQSYDEISFSQMNSNYRLGDIIIQDADIGLDICSEHSNTIGSDYILSHDKSNRIALATQIVLRHIQKYEHLFPQDIEDSTVVHLRLGDAVGGTHFYERRLRPFEPSWYQSIIPDISQGSVYVIGKCHFGYQCSANYDECNELSKSYMENVLSLLKATHFDGGHPDIDLCFAVKAKLFVQGRGCYSKLIVEVRRCIGLKSIETPSHDFSDLYETDKNKIITVAFCDWWQDEYCGGTFNLHDNFFVNLIKTHVDSDVVITTVDPHQNPDILFYSVFGQSNGAYRAGRKVFYAGEPVSHRTNADFNITFDASNTINTRLPLWVCYFDHAILSPNRFPPIPTREKFCSYIATNPRANRQAFVEQLSSQYKRVDCGGRHLNNIGGAIPPGTNASGKIEHNTQYKFAIAFENTQYPGYVTEKICDVYKSGCIPIYWGTPDIIKDFNPSTFINANDFPDLDALIDHIRRVDCDDALYASYFKDPVLSDEWMQIFADPNCAFFKQLVSDVLKG